MTVRLARELAELEKALRKGVADARPRVATSKPPEARKPTTLSTRRAQAVLAKHTIATAGKLSALTPKTKVVFAGTSKEEADRIVAAFRSEGYAATQYPLAETIDEYVVEAWVVDPTRPRFTRACTA